MKPTSVALLCLPLLLVLTHLTLARRGGAGGGGKSTTNRGSSTSTNRGSTNTGKKPTNRVQPQPGSYPKQADSNQGRPSANNYGHPQQGLGAGYPNQPSAGGGYGGGYGGGGRMNYNPNNRILSPGYGGSYGYGGHGGAGGSPYSRSVQSMGYGPSARSRGFGRGAVMAAGAGVITGMALGYGLGRFPRPPFHYQSSEEERYYNNYMQNKYGSRSTDRVDYSRDYVFSSPDVPFAEHMYTCTKRQDLELSENKKKGTTAPASPIVPMATDSPIVPMATDNSTSNNTSGSNDTVVLTALSPDQADNKPRAAPFPPASEDLSKIDDRDTDIVSIVEIGYPALIDQMKARRCLELYMVISDKFIIKRARGGVQGAGPGRGLQQALAVVVGTLLRLASSN